MRASPWAIRSDWIGRQTLYPAKIFLDGTIHITTTKKKKKNIIDQGHHDTEVDYPHNLPLAKRQETINDLGTFGASNEVAPGVGFFSAVAYLSFSAHGRPRSRNLRDDLQ
jgi:hypothetical protein